MDTEQLSLFADVVASGSFAAAAKKRDLDPSSVSRGIKALEAELGARLFQRTTRRIGLTEAGERFLARIEPVLAELELARGEVRAAADLPAGTLRLTASIAFGQHRIVPLLGALRMRYPQLGLHCIFSDANLDLVAERIDLAVRLGPRVEGDLVAAKLADTRYRVVASPDYRDRHPVAVPTELAKHRCILFDLPAYRSRWIFREPSGRLEDVPVDGDLTLSPVGSIRDAALAGLGPALLPDWLIGSDLERGALVDLFPGHDVTATTFETAAYAVYPSRAFLPRKVRVVIDFLRESLRRPPSQRPEEQDRRHTDGENEELQR